MADLLRSGHTMLSLACPVCNNPIFKDKNEEKFCPVCNKKIIIVDKEPVSDLDKKNIEPLVKDQDLMLWSSVKAVISKKVEWLIDRLNDETQIKLIESYLNLLSTFYDLYKKLTEIL